MKIQYPVKIRTEAEYPGTSSGKTLQKGIVEVYPKPQTVQHKEHFIYFYELANGEGWIHDFNPIYPEKLNLTSLNDVTKFNFFIPMFFYIRIHVQCSSPTAYIYFLAYIFCSQLKFLLEMFTYKYFCFRILSTFLWLISIIFVIQNISQYLKICYIQNSRC